ncbi:hypothetical protein ACTFIW_012052 [Dictyostelium discoideum]
MSSNRREMLALLMAYQALWWSDTRPISSVRTTLETMPQEESQLDWRAYSRILQCKSRSPQPSFRDESQIIVQSNQELQLATEEGSVQSNPTSVRSNLSNLAQNKNRWNSSSISLEEYEGKLRLYCPSADCIYFMAFPSISYSDGDASYISIAAHLMENVILHKRIREQ